MVYPYNVDQNERKFNSSTFEEDKEMLIKLAVLPLQLEFYDEFIRIMKQTKNMIKLIVKDSLKNNSKLSSEEIALLNKYLDLIESRTSIISIMLYGKRFDFEMLLKNDNEEKEIINKLLLSLDRQDIYPVNKLGLLMKKYNIYSLFENYPTFGRVNHFNNDYILLAILLKRGVKFF